MPKEPAINKVTQHTSTQNETDDAAFRELSDAELDATGGGVYAFVAMTHYWVACAALGVYLGQK
jgi:hypothetical protein